MASSYRTIDYRVRPGKSIERKMLADMFRKLVEFGSLDGYRYIGFGSLYFSDFTLFHRLLGFKSMISIEDEDDLTKRRRFDFNAPFGYVKVKYGLSTNILSGLDWDERTVLWLDYDGTLEKTVLQDIEIVISKATSGSMLLVSVNAESPCVRDENNEKRSPLDSLRILVGAEMVPAEVNGTALSGWKTAETFRTIIHNKILDTLNKINGARPKNKQVAYRQVANIHYDDGAKMLTVGGLLYEASQQNAVDRCAFHSLEFSSHDDKSYRINPPFLTFTELRKIDAMIPLSVEDFKKLPILKADIERYIKVYRYFPHFVEAEV